MGPLPHKAGVSQFDKEEKQQMSNNQSVTNRAKMYQLALFPLNNGATNVYFVLILQYIASFGSNVLGITAIFASLMVTGMLYKFCCMFADSNQRCCFVFT